MSLPFIITHRIAGLSIRTEADVAIPHLLLPPFSQFQVGDCPADIRYRAQGYDPAASQAAPLSGDERERLRQTIHFPLRWLNHDLLSLPEIGACVRVGLEQPALTHIGLRWRRASIRNYDRCELDLFYPPAERGSFARPLIIARYRNSLASFFPNFAAVMIHAAGVIRQGGAVLFLAPDEGGKTSAVRLATREPILNDDHLILRQTDDGVMAHGTPFGPLTSGPLQARVSGLFLLEKGDSFTLTPARASEALRHLWDEHLHTWSVMPKSLKRQAFDVLYNACHQAPVYRLRFARTYIDWDAVDRVLTSS